MTRRKLVVTPTSDGKVQVEAFGYAGNACAKAMGPLLAALGPDSGDHAVKEAYHATEERIAETESARG